MCFSVQQLKKRLNGVEQAVNTIEVDEATSSPDELSSRPRSFRSRVRAIQTAQRFLLCNSSFRSSHPSYGSRVRDSKSARDSALLLLPLGGSARSAYEINASCGDVGSPYISLHPDQTSTIGLSSPKPLPSPRLAAQKPNAYRLPLPMASADTTSFRSSPPRLLSPRLTETVHGHRLDRAVLPASSTKLCVSSTPTVPFFQILPTCDNPSLSSSIITSRSQVQLSRNPELALMRTQNATMAGACTEPELQPLPPPKHISAAQLLRRFGYEELASACQNFSLDRSFDSGDASFYGAIKTKVHGKAVEYQEVVVVSTKETEQQVLQHWVLRLSMVPQKLHEQPHVCKLVGFYGKDGCSENMLVYEKLRKGSLCTMLFEQTGAPPLDWPTRIKIVYGAAQGLASLHESFPDEVLYKDFRTSSIQVDADHTSKISGYRPVGAACAEAETSQSNPRIHAYRAPETASRGELTQKSNVWSFGVVLLEVLSGKQNKVDERSVRDKRDNLVKWAKPFLIDEGKLFLLMDPKLQGRFPVRGAKMVADLAMLCLHIDPDKRPTMREAVTRLQNVHEIGYTPRSRAKEPHKSDPASSRMMPSVGVFSVKSILTDEQGSPPHRSSARFDIVRNPPLKPLTIPPRCCSEDIAHDYAPPPLTHIEF